MLNIVQHHQYRVFIPYRFDSDRFAQGEKLPHFLLFILVEISLHLRQASLDWIEKSIG